MADAHAKHHDYHLVDPSPWPVVGAISAFILAVGAVIWMHEMYSAAPLVFGRRHGRRALHHVMPGGATSSARRNTRATTPAWCRSRTATA